MTRAQVIQGAKNLNWAEDPTTGRTVRYPMTRGTTKRKPTVIAPNPPAHLSTDTVSLAASPYAAPERNPMRAAFPVRTDEKDDTKVCLGLLLTENGRQ